MAVGTLDIIDLAEAREALNDTEVDTSDDTELENYVAAVSRFLDWMYGPVIQRSVTESHDGGGSCIVLAVRPVASVTSVTVDDVALSASDWHAERSSQDRTLLSGEISRMSGTSRGGVFEFGVDNVDVVYTAGRFADRASVDARFRQAAVLTLQHAFRAEQRTAFQDSQGFVTPTSGYPKDWDLRAVRSILMGERRRRGIGVA